MTWDADGSRYGRGAGLSIEVDGQEVTRRRTLGRLMISIARVPNPPIRREINRAVQLVRGQFPKASASSNDEPENLHDAIDGRVWFYPEMPNGWTSGPSSRPQWYAIDFGKSADLDRAELAFFEDETKFAAPAKVTVEYWQEGRWRTLASATPLANGITRLQWPARPISRIRALMSPSNARAIRLVEFKAISE